MSEPISVVGIEEVLAKNSQFLARLKQHVEQALDKAALDTEAEAKRRCPVVTGRLRASITAERTEPLVREVGTVVFYATPVEYRKPYLRPAFEIHSRTLQQALEQLGRRVSGR